MAALSSRVGSTPTAMSAVVFDGTVRVCTDLPVPTPLPDEALIRVRLAGICGTDLELTRGYQNFQGIAGHEFVGEVARCAESSLVGRRVCAEINVGCAQCDFCRAGRRAHCRRRTVVGIKNRPGAFAEYLTVPIVNLHAIPDDIDDRSAVFVEPLAAAFEVLEQLPVHTSQRVAVLGDGRLAALCAQVLAGAGAVVTVFGKHPAKMRRIANFGVATVTLPEPIFPEYDVVVEATGSPAGLLAALSLVRARGTVVLKSTYAGAATLDFSIIPVNEITILGSRCGPFPRAIEALLQGSVRVEALIDACYPLKEAKAALRHASNHETFKVLLSAE